MVMDLPPLFLLHSPETPLSLFFLLSAFSTFGIGISSVAHVMPFGFCFSQSFIREIKLRRGLVSSQIAETKVLRETERVLGQTGPSRNLYFPTVGPPR